MPIKTGDTILHKPSGEKWVVAFADAGYVCACGWPESYGKEEDCEIIESVSEDESLILLRKIASKQNDDSRKRFALRILEKRGEAL